MAADAGGSSARLMAQRAARRAGRSLGLFGHYVRFNLSAGMEYRASFLMQVVGMVLNNASFIVFWWILYGRLQDIKGYAFSDVMFLWALSSVAFGLAAVFLENARYLSRAITTGELDVYLLQPRPVLFNFLSSRMSISGWGDLLFGLVLFALTQQITLPRLGLFAVFSILGAVVLVSMRILYHSLSFFLGNAEEFASTASDLVLNFMLYPGSIFDGPASWVLHTIIPAALVAYIPARLFRSFDAATLLMVTAADALIAAVSVAVFRLGLRVYESGNRMGART